MTNTQEQIVDGLSRRGAVEIAALFRAGCRLRNDSGFPVRKYFIGHAVREIANALGEHLRVERPKPPAWSVFVANMKKRYVEAMRDQLDQPTTSIQIPRRAAELILEYIDHDTAYPERRKAYMQGLVDEVFPSPRDVARVAKLVGDLQSIRAHDLAHVRGPDEVTDEATTLERWDSLEALLAEMFPARHPQYAELDAAAEELNEL